MKLTLEEAQDQELLHEFANVIVPWYESNKRSMPWRDDPKPYRVWVSEIMLQQTRIEAVRGYFDRFLSALPDIEALAKIPEDELMKLWEGLGYYNRVRNMQKAAIILVNDYDGELPKDYEKLRSLPGIGNYTAGAIASIAYGIAAPAVDGNVLRVMMRLFACKEDIAKPSLKTRMEKLLLPEIPLKHAGEFNQGIMELGETICIPNGRPLCEQCPVQAFCRANLQGVTDQLPVKSGPKARRVEEKCLFLFEYEGSILLHKRAPKGLLAGLWEYPMCDRVECNAMIDKLMDIGLIEYQDAGMATHIFSHVEWHIQGYWYRLTNEAAKEKIEQMLSPEQSVWVTFEQMQDEYALPTAFAKYRKWIAQLSR